MIKSSLIVVYVTRGAPSHLWRSVTPRACSARFSRLQCSVRCAWCPL